MLKKIFEPINIGNLRLSNRIVMAPMATHFATIDGYVTDRLIDYYVERAINEVGLIISESCYVHPEGRGGSNRLSIYTDAMVSGLRKLTSAIHTHGSKVAIQLHHGGRQISPDAISEYPVSASSIPCIGWGVRAMPRTLTVSEIKVLVEAFGKAAKRAKDAGFDAIQILAAHGYLLWSFLSPFGNHRSDEYGGKLINRIRFLLEIIECIRENVGKIPIMVRLNGSDYLNGGITLKDSTAMAKKLEEAGIDAINVTAGTRESHEYQVPPRALPDGCNAHLAAAIKEAVNIPVSIAGKIRSPEVAENILQKGSADLIELGRALLCDPEWLRKAKENRYDDILPCISCIRCDERLFSNLDVACTINAAAGHEKECKIRLAQKPKKVLIAGAGPAGLETARVAALRGHKVILYEKDVVIGGNLKLATFGQYNTEFQELLSYFERQIRKIGVKLRLGEKLNAEKVAEIKPDVVVVATGSSPLTPKISGVEYENVVTAHDVLAGRAEVGKKVVIWGSGLVAFDVADFLSEKNRHVTVVTRGIVRMGQENSNNKLLLKRVCEKGVRIMINTQVKRIGPNSLTVQRGGKEEIIAMDNFVLSLGTCSNRKLLMDLRGKNSNLHSIGDCVKPREAFEAIHEGYRVALTI